MECRFCSRDSLLCGFKEAHCDAEFAHMTPDSDATASPRFRTARIERPDTPVACVRLAMADGAAMLEVLEEELRDAVASLDAPLVLELGRTALDHEDRFRRFGAARATAHAVALVSDELARGDGDWWSPLDGALGLLADLLEASPHEPDLLDLLGVFAFRLGAASLGRACLAAACELEPDRADLRAHLDGCDTQAPALAVGGATPELDARREAIEALADRATELRQPTISLCMIVKDEAEQLPACLEAVAPFVDELVVVDTGSTDDTRAIAASFGATVHEFAWNGSFSDARNHALERCTGDWILWLDADEQLVAEDGPLLRQLVRAEWVEGYHVVETHFVGGEEHGSEASHAPMRLFRRRPEYRWRGRVHEQVAWALPGWLPGRVRSAPVRVNHYGYLASVVRDRGKHERNLDLLLAQIGAGSRTPFDCFNVGTEHAAMSDWSQARTWFEEALALAREESGWHEAQFAPLMVQRTVVARRMDGDADGVAELVEEGLALWPAYTDLRFERALMRFDRGELDAAEVDVRAALAQGDAPARFVAIAGKGTFQARTLLARIHRARGEWAEARALLEEAVREAPRWLAAVDELLRLRLEAGTEPDVACAELDALLGRRAHGSAVNQLVGSVLHQHGHFGHAQARYDRVLAAQPGHAPTLLARGELRLAQGALLAAWEDGMALDELDPLAAHAAATAFLAAVALGEPERLEEPARRIAASETITTAERAAYAAWHARIVGRDGVRTLLSPDRAAADVVFRNLEALAKLRATDAFEVLYPLATQVEPDERERRLRLAELYARCHFADMAGEELMACAERFGPDARVLGGLGTVATLKGMWEDAEVFLSEALQLDPDRAEVRRLLEAVRSRIAG